MRKFFNEKITSRDIEKFLKNKIKTQISAGSGLLLMKTTANSASWQYRYLFNGKKFVYSLGSFADVDLPTAQAKHKELWQKVAAGVNVAVEKQKTKTSTADFVENYTISTLADFYIKNSKKFNNATKTAASEKSLIKRAFLEPDVRLFNETSISNSSGKKITISKFLKLPANDINEIEIKNFIENVKQPTTKLRIAKLLFAIYEKAKLYKTTTKISNNPAEIIKSGEIEFEASKPRDRIVSDAELKELFNLLNKSKNQILATATKLLFMLGVRKNELLQATWNEFDFENSFWTLPAERSKNGKAIKIPLSQPVITLLKTLQQSRSKFVFRSFNKNNNSSINASTLNVYLNNLIKNNVIIKGKITPHDTRRFVRTTLNKILDGNIVEKQFICERVLNHSLMLQGVNTQILNTYLIDDFFKERKQALNKLADYITSITNE